jgi:hypothetical protein
MAKKETHEKTTQEFNGQLADLFKTWVRSEQVD